MAEIRKEVKVFKIDYQCPKCGIGFLRSIGKVLTSYPPIYPSKCTNSDCDYTKNIRNTYPYYEYEEVEN